MWREPCPNCRERVTPKVGYGGIKICPRCGFQWFESVGGGGQRPYEPPLA